MIAKLIEGAALTLAFLYLLVQMVEAEGGAGPEKRDAAIAKAKELLAELPIPAVLKLLLGNDVVIGTLIDWTVAILNKTGWFVKSDPTLPLVE